MGNGAGDFAKKYIISEVKLGETKITMYDVGMVSLEQYDPYAEKDNEIIINRGEIPSLCAFLFAMMKHHQESEK